MGKQETIAGMLGDLGIRFKWSGLCFWMDPDDASDHLGTIAALGGRWSGKRQAWYIRCEQEAI